jgi:Rrf2 family protein
MAANSRFAVATHILTALAHMEKHAPKELRQANGLISSKVLAGSVNTNPVVVRRIVAELARAGIVVSRQGKRGGIELGRAPEKITLLDVYKAMGAPAVFAFNSNEPNPHCPVSSRMVRVLDPVFAKVQDGVRERLEKIRLSDLVRKIG